MIDWVGRTGGLGSDPDWEAGNRLNPCQNQGNSKPVVTLPEISVII